MPQSQRSVRIERLLWIVAGVLALIAATLSYVNSGGRGLALAAAGLFCLAMAFRQRKPPA